MSFTSNEKSYGGYSSFSPMRNAERLAEKKKQERDVPKYVHDKAEEIMDNQKEQDEGKAWAVAWSIYCKYKEPGSKHCKKEQSDYFPGRKKKAEWSRQDQQNIRRIALKTSGILDQLVSLGLLHISKMIKEECNREREMQLVWYLLTEGKFPTYMSRFSTEARLLGIIAKDMQKEEKPQDVTYTEEKKAYRTLLKICKYTHAVWSSKVWSKVWFATGEYPIRSIRIEFLDIPSIKYSVEYTRLLRHLFD